MNAQPAFHRFLNHFLRNIELYLSGAGLVVILLVPTLLAPLGFDWIAIAAITAAIVGVLHGLIFWLIRRRQRQVREAAIQDIQRMLKDVVNNKLLVLSVGLELPPAEDQTTRAAMADQGRQAIGQITEALNHISEESLVLWKRRYGLPE